MPNDSLNLKDLITVKKSDEVDSTGNEGKKEEKELSPLERMKNFKETHTGTIVNNEDITYDNEKKVLKNSVENDRREDDFNAYLSDMDDLIDAAKDVELSRPITGPIEEAIAIDQLDMIARQKKGKVSEAPKLVTGETANIPTEELTGTDLHVNGQKIDFVVEKGESNETKSTEENKNNENNESSDEKKEDSNTNESGNTNVKEDEKHKQLVNILIDKTGYGVSDIEFTPEEKKKLELASTIRITEVENIDLDSIVFEAPDQSFVENLTSAEEPSFGASSVPLVASRYRVKMKGLGYGQLADLVMNQQSPTFEQHYKRYSVIYNNIASTSIGNFDTFEDFLKNTAQQDIDMMYYGLVLATYPEVDSVTIRCEDCGRRYDHSYFVRETLDLKNADTKYLEKLKELMDCEPSKFEEYHKEAPIFKRKAVRLPHSGNIIEFGIATAYDYLYQIIHNVLDPSFAEKYKDDVNGIMSMNILFLNMIRAVSIKTGEMSNGKPVYKKYDTFDDMLQILYRMPPEDISIMTAILNKYSESYTVQFNIANTKCPACGHVNENNILTMADILFFKFQLLMSTDVEVSNILDL